MCIRDRFPRVIGNRGRGTRWWRQILTESRNKMPHSSAMDLWTRLWGRYHVPQNVFLVYWWFIVTYHKHGVTRPMMTWRAWKKQWKVCYNWTLLTVIHFVYELHTLTVLHHVHVQGVSLFSTMSLISWSFFQLCDIIKRNEYSTITCNFLTWWHCNWDIMYVYLIKLHVTIKR